MWPLISVYDMMSICCFLSALGSVPAWLQERTVNSLSACLSDCLSKATSDQYPHIVDTITACLDGFSLGERVITVILTAHFTTDIC